MNLDRYLDDFGRDLAHAATKRRLRRRHKLAVLIPTAAALGIAVAALLPGLNGDADTLAKARAALAPRNEMVHMVMRWDLPGDNAVNPPRIEQWYVGEPLAWRSITDFPRSGRSTITQEISVAGDRFRIRDPERNVVTIYRGFRNAPMQPGGGGDPVKQVRDMLAKGKVQDEGIVTVDGRRVRRLVGINNAPRALVVRTVYLMDPETFAPISVQYESMRGKLTSVGGVTIEKYERLPINAATLKLLRIQGQTPSTKYVWRDVKHPVRKK
jgi:hypothetical protein